MNRVEEMNRGMAGATPLNSVEIPSLQGKVSDEEWAVRVDLAAAYRMVAHYGWDDLIFTHLSARIPGPEGDVREIRRKHLEHVRIAPADQDAGFSLSIEMKTDTVHYTGDKALRVAGVLLPSMNRYGGSKRQVESAVRLLDEVGDPRAVFNRLFSRPGYIYKPVHKVEYEVRLALAKWLCRGDRAVAQEDLATTVGNREWLRRRR